MKKIKFNRKTGKMKVVNNNASLPYSEEERFRFFKERMNDTHRIHKNKKAYTRKSKHRNKQES